MKPKSMNFLKKPVFKHLLLWILFWLVQSLLFSGGHAIQDYLVKNVAIVGLQAVLVYLNIHGMWKLLDQGKYMTYGMAALVSIYGVYAISKEAIGLSFSLFIPGVKFIIYRAHGWWPTDFWSILSGSAPYSIALLASTVYLLIKHRPAEISTKQDSTKTSKEESENHTLMLKEGKVVHRLDLRDILFIQGMKEYVSWHTRDKKVVTLHSLASLENSLASKGFMRTHKSFIVNTRCVNTVKYDALEIPGNRIPIGRSYREKVQGHFKSDL